MKKYTPTILLIIGSLLAIGGISRFVHYTVLWHGKHQEIKLIQNNGYPGWHQISEMYGYVTQIYISILPIVIASIIVGISARLITKQLQS